MKFVYYCLNDWHDNCYAPLECLGWLVVMSERVPILMRWVSEIVFEVFAPTILQADKCFLEYWGLRKIPNFVTVTVETL